MRCKPAVLAVLVALLGSTASLRAANPVIAFGPGDVTPPTLLGAIEVTGPVTPISDVILAFDDALDALTMPTGTDLADVDVEVGGVRDNATSAVLTYTGFAAPGQLDSFVTVHLATTFTDGSQVTVSYTPHGHPIRDQAGNAAGASPPSALIWLDATGFFGVMFALADGAYGANHVGLVLPDAPVLPLPDPSAFTVTRNNDLPVAATRVSFFPGVGGRILDLDLPICLQPGDQVSATYTKPGINPLRNSASMEADTTDPAITVFVQLQPSDSCGSVGPGGSVSTGAAPSSDNPVSASVTVPSAATISIAEVTTEQLPTADFDFLSDSLSISVVAPAGTFDTSHPIALAFAIDGPTMRAAGVTAQTLTIFRNGVPIGDCPGSDVASPDPCVASRLPATAESDYAVFSVLTSAASRWTFGVQVPFAFRSPVDQMPTVNVANAGRGIPVRFSLGGDRGLNIFAAGYPKSQVVSCDGNAPTDVVEQTVTAGSSSLSYDPLTATYTYVWKTDKSWAKAPPGPCRNLILKFDGGSQQVARFRFT